MFAMMSDKPISGQDKCPKCGGNLGSGMSDFAGENPPYVFCLDCNLFAIPGDNQWFDSKTCEGGNVMPFLRMRRQAMAKV